MRKFCILLITALSCNFVHAQLSVAKIVGKGANQSKMGFGLFAFYDFPISEYGNSSIRLELMDLVYFPAQNKDVDPSKGYISVKLGYRYIFSDTKTGFYIEPQAGYCRVASVYSYEPEATYGDGVALAFESGYSLEVGQRGQTLNFGLKYETDRAGALHTINSLGFRVSYTFNWLRRRDD